MQWLQNRFERGVAKLVSVATRCQLVERDVLSSVCKYFFRINISSLEPFWIDRVGGPDIKRLSGTINQIKRHYVFDKNHPVILQDGQSFGSLLF